jgi:hypothetical protein
MPKYSQKINDALISNPNYLPCFMNNHFSGGPGDPFGDIPENPLGDWHINPKDNPRFNEFVTTVMVLERYFDINTPAIDLFALSRPLIISCPTTLNVGDTFLYTITGKRFGAGLGSIYITIIDTGMQINPVVLQWSDTAITFLLPTNVGGVPFHAGGRLTVKNPGGYDHSVQVIVKPIENLFFAEVTFSDSGKALYDVTYLPKLGYVYEKVNTLTSPTLPQEYELFNNPFLSTSGLFLDILTWTYCLPEGIESSASVSLLAGPYESGNNLQINVKVTDDWYWNYTVRACFYIMVPQGYPTQGWTRQGGYGG